MSRIAQCLAAISEMAAFIAELIAALARWCWQGAVEKARELLSPGYRQRKREKWIAEKHAQELAARKKEERTVLRTLVVLDCARQLPAIPTATIRSMHDYDDPSVAPYYKGKSKFFNEHYLHEALSEARLADYLKAPLRVEDARGEKRDTHVLLVSGGENDFREYAIYRTGDGEFFCIEWWHHDWYNWQGALRRRSEGYRDDFGWQQ
jgi:hypothetical protein